MATQREANGLSLPVGCQQVGPSCSQWPGCTQGPVTEDAAYGLGHQQRSGACRPLLCHTVAVACCARLPWATLRPHALAVDQLKPGVAHRALVVVRARLVQARLAVGAVCSRHTAGHQAAGRHQAAGGCEAREPPVSHTKRGTRRWCTISGAGVTWDKQPGAPPGPWWMPVALLPLLPLPPPLRSTVCQHRSTHTPSHPSHPKPWPVVGCPAPERLLGRLQGVQIHSLLALL